MEKDKYRERKKGERERETGRAREKRGIVWQKEKGKGLP